MSADPASRIQRRLVDRYGDRVDVSTLPEPHATVLLVVAVHGYVSNGGFRHLFEGELPGDPKLRLAVAAHDRIGATQAATAMRMALATFPGFSPPDEVERRIEIYESRYSIMDVVDGVKTPDSIYFDQLEEIRDRLDEYVLAHPDAFEDANEA